MSRPTPGEGFLRERAVKKVEGSPEGIGGNLIARNL